MTDDELRAELTVRFKAMGPVMIADLRRELSLYQQAQQYTRDEVTHHRHIRRIIEAIVKA